ncbi:uncharacterized protein PHALS_00399 [Plasmopara halstedii]|uniref:Uncharacterized protein n=1 Tax=Plasmopara halstedii TaxID=4781 RepID=A0A0P1A7C4_PLAHL|nr:uncharacterized protein PHALS_00399 [Plasmopara halstedii]CEG36079.1 hypothetical protein PHALS_00399 [Plasmopara halstedii]|eukprot:XP_024572448.1 hypothetical protein PHALS_00399 [Plasmopara halstedii]
MRKNLRRQAHQSKRLGHQRITYLLWLFLMPTTGMKILHQSTCQFISHFYRT